MNLLLDYSLRIAPGFVVGAALLVLLPRRAVEWRIAVYVVLFVLARDAMTPLGMWSIDARAGTLRLPEATWLLLVLGALSGGIVALIHALEPGLRPLVVWRKGGALPSVAVGALGALAVAALPFAYRRVAGAAPLVALAPSAWPPLIFMALLGNLYEEYLFRGLIQGALERDVTPLRAAVLAALAFGVFHASLACVVTTGGAAVLVFTVYEGVLAGLVRMRHGVLASTLTHGGGIFLIASGLLA